MITRGLGIHAGLLLLAFVAWMLFNVPPLVKSNHIAVHGNQFRFALLGFTLAGVYVTVPLVARRQLRLTPTHLALLLDEAAIIFIVAATCLRKALAFFGVL